MSERPLVWLVAGARPNFVKLAPVLRALKRRDDVEPRIVHTGQHYDEALSARFFTVLEMDPPDVNLDAGSGSHAVQTAVILERFEALLLARRPAGVVVFGDVNSTLACSLAAVKLGVPVAHVEAGLRSFDRSMPEEINRIVTDTIAELFLVSEPAGTRNLLAEGHAPSRIREVGNVMIDSLRAAEPRVRALAPWERFALEPKRYGFVTLHRPSNVDDPAVLRRLLDCLARIAASLPLVFAVHPRTAARIEALGFRPGPSLRMTEPIDYLESIGLQSEAAVVLTDSGGIQEEASCLAVPCLTLRWNTERPVTVELGSSTLVGNDPERIWAGWEDVRAGRYKRSSPIPLWDGRAGARAATEIAAWLGRA